MWEEHSGFPCARMCNHEVESDGTGEGAVSLLYKQTKSVGHRTLPDVKTATPIIGLLHLENLRTERDADNQSLEPSCALEDLKTERDTDNQPVEQGIAMNYFPSPNCRCWTRAAFSQRKVPE